MEREKKNVALVLGAGGAKGYAHIGVIRALEEAGYNITSVAGTSMGALIGGLYAAGKLDEAFAWLKTLDKKAIFKLADLKNISRDGIIKGEYVFAELRAIVGDVPIEDLSMPYCAISADLESGQEVVFTKGNLLDAVRASISMPVFFKPKVIDGRKYVDGGVVNGLPINRVARTEGDVVVAINLDTYGVNTELKKKKTKTQPEKNSVLSKVVDMIVPDIIEDGVLSIQNYFEGYNWMGVLLNSYYVSLKQNKLMMAERYQPDIYLNIDLKGYSTNDFHDAKVIANLGYKQMKACLEERKAQTQ